MTVLYTLDVWDETTLWTTIEKGEAELHRLLERVGGQVLTHTFHNEDDPIRKWVDYTITNEDGEKFSAMIYPNWLDYSTELDKEV